MCNNFITLSRRAHRQFHYIQRQYSHVVIKIFPFCDKQKKYTNKRGQVFDVVCIEIAYTTAAIMLQKFKRTSSPYYVSNIT